MRLQLELGVDLRQLVQLQLLYELLLELLQLLELQHLVHLLLLLELLLVLHSPLLPCLRVGRSLPPRLRAGLRTSGHALRAHSCCSGGACGLGASAEVGDDGAALALGAVFLLVRDLAEEGVSADWRVHNGHRAEC